MYHDEKQVIFKAQTRSVNLEDKPWLDLASEELIINIEDFKAVMSIYKTFGDIDRKQTNRMLNIIIPCMIFLKSSHCEDCCEFLNLGDKTHSYNLFEKLDNLYNVDHMFNWDLRRYYTTKRAMQENLWATINAFGITLFAFARKIGINASALSAMLYGYTKLDVVAYGKENKNSKKPKFEMSDEAYKKCLKELHYIFNTYDLGFMFNPEDWKLPEGIEWKKKVKE